jgi:outer membrane protein insertion porin family
LEKKKVQQPLIIDDNEPSEYDQLSIEAVRNIYIDPEQVDAQPVELEVHQLPNDPPKDDGIPTSEYNALDLSGAYEKIDLIGIDSTPTEHTSFINDHPSNKGAVVTAAFARDTRDKILFPSYGYLSKVVAETTIPGSDLEYYKISVRTRWYQRLAKDSVLGLSGTVGYGGGYGDVGQFPFYKNFFAGGASSVRGYAAGSLGPRATGQSGDDPLGGSRRLLANANLYFPVPGLENGDNTRLSLFMDAGQVYGHSEPVSFFDLRSSVGVAFNWSTAIGPLALSYGHPPRNLAADHSLAPAGQLP